MRQNMKEQELQLTIKRLQTHKLYILLINHSGIKLQIKDRDG